MNYYTFTNSKGKQVISDCYIRFIRVNEPSFLNELIDNDLIYSSVDDLNLFKDRLIDVENNSSTANGNHIYGIVLKFLLDKKYKTETLVEITKELSKKYKKNQVIFSFLSKEGKGNFLNVYISDREYFPEGKELLTYYKKDCYKSAKTKSFCSSDNKDAVLYKKAGEIKSKKVSYFSNKVSFFRFKENEFVTFWNNLRIWFIELLKKLVNLSVVTGINFKQYVYKKLSFRDRKSAKVWNKAFKTISNSFNDALTGLMFTGMFNDTNQGIMFGLYQNYKNIIEQESFNYKKGRRIFSIPLTYTSSVKEAKENSQLFIEKFNSSLQQTMNNIYEMV